MPEPIPIEPVPPLTPNGITAPLSEVRPIASPTAGFLKVPGYELLYLVGRGGMGIVYKARQLTLNRTVALKMILGGEVASEEARQRFMEEARALATLQHPNIVQVYEVGQVDDLPYMALEYLQGGSLAERLKTPLPPNEAARLVEQLAEGVHAAHEQGIVHRDLKPANVLFGSSPDEPKITDFGLATRVKDPLGLTQSGAILGTPSYMAPEQARGESKNVGPTADLHALGAILYECLSGRPPFTAATTAETIVQVLLNDPVPPRQLQPATPQDLETICLKCLEKEPGKRYASARELANELQRFQNGEPIRARPVSKIERGWRWCRRNPAIAGLAAAVMLLLLAGSLTSALLAGMAVRNATLAENNAHDARKEAARADEKAREAEARRREAELAEGRERDRAKDERAARLLAKAAETEAQEQSRQTEAARAAVERLLYLSRIQLAQRAWQESDVLLARQLLRDCPQPLRNWEYDWLSRLCEGGAIRIQAHEQPIKAFAISPHGTRAATAAPDAIRIWDWRSGRMMRELASPMSPVVRLLFSGDGTKLIVSTAEERLRIWDIALGTESNPVGDAAVPSLGLTLSPQGELLTCATPPPQRPRGGNRLDATTESAALKLLDLSTGRELRMLPGHTALVTAAAFSPDGKRLATGDRTGVLKIWDTATWQPRHSLNAHHSRIDEISFSGDGRVATIDREGSVQIHDGLTGERLLGFWQGSPRFAGPSVQFSSDGQRLLTSSKAGVQLRRGTTGEPLAQLRLSRQGEAHAGFSPDGRWILVSDALGEIHVLDGAGQQEWRTYFDATVQLSPYQTPRPDGAQIAVAPFPGSYVDLCAARTGKASKRLEGVVNGVTNLAYSQDGRWLASVSLPNTLKLWNIETGKEVWSQALNPALINAPVFSPDNTLLALVAPAGGGALFEVATGKQLRLLVGHTKNPNTVAFSPDSNWLATTSDDGTIRLWDRTGTAAGIVSTHTGPVWGVAFSPDSRLLAWSTEDKSVVFYDRVAARTVRSLKQFREPVTSLCFSPDSKRLATVGDLLRVWEVEQGQEVLAIRGPHAGQRVWWHRDGHTIGVDGGRQPAWFVTTQAPARP